VAREKNVMTKKGAYIDGIVDRVVETLFVISLLSLSLPDIYFNMKYWLMLNLAFGTYMTSFAKAYADHRKAVPTHTIESMPGLLERGERVILYMVSLIIYLINPYLSAVLLVISAILSVLTSMQRIVFVVNSHKKHISLADVKQVIVVRSDIKMGKGKLAAQVAHASIQAFLAMEEDMKAAWLNSGQKKVVLKVESLKSLLNLQTQAIKAGLNPALISDAGKTQLEKGTITCMGVGPAESDKLDAIFGRLKLL